MKIDHVHSDIVNNIFNFEIRGIIFNLVDLLKLIGEFSQVTNSHFFIMLGLPLLLYLSLLLSLSLLNHLLKLLQREVFLELKLPLLVLQLLLLLLDDLQLLLCQLSLVFKHLLQLSFLLPHDVFLLVVDGVKSEYGLHLGLGLFLGQLARLLLSNPECLGFLFLPDGLGLFLLPLELLGLPLLLESLECRLVLAPPRIFLLQLNLIHGLHAVLLAILLALPVV